MKIAIVSNPQKAGAADVVRRLLKKAASFKDAIFLLDRPLARALALEKLARTDGEMSREADLLVALGGDGTLLAAVKRVARPDLPVLGVNLGGMGFLTEFAADEFIRAFPKILKDEFRLDERMMLGVTLSEGKKSRSFEALNDAVITKGALSRMLSLDVYIGKNYLTTYKSDGLIVSTPTGSTAHSLSGGGPIVTPDCAVMILTPICPHTLSNRPLIVSQDKKIKIQLTSSSEGVGLTLDGQLGRPLKTGDCLEIEGVGRTIPLVRLKDDYFEILREKLGWRGSIENQKSKIKNQNDSL